jgi:hypothetical protein
MRTKYELINHNWNMIIFLSDCNLPFISTSCFFIYFERIICYITDVCYSKEVENCHNRLYQFWIKPSTLSVFLDLEFLKKTHIYSRVFSQKEISLCVFQRW